MRIGVMLRSFEDRQGIGVYTQNLMEHLLPLDKVNEYVLFYRNPELVGRYARHANVREIALTASNKGAWDQFAVPMAARREQIDLLFHTKFTVPFFTCCKTVMTVHGASWFVRPDLYANKLDVAYIRLIMPLYCHKADFIISNSDLTTDDYIRILGVPPAKIKTVRLGTNASYKPVTDQARLAGVRAKFSLPDRFILSVIRHDPRKNFKNILAAFRLLRQRLPCRLVVTGLGVEKYRAEHRLDADAIGADIHFLGWVDQADLPVLYSMARCHLFPSVYEEFGIPVTEAMACGCPPVVSTTGALPEVAGDAGLLVDPFNPAAIADALERIYRDDSLYRALVERCLIRSRLFTWERCANETLAILNAVGAGKKP